MKMNNNRNKVKMHEQIFGGFLLHERSDSRQSWRCVSNIKSFGHHFFVGCSCVSVLLFFFFSFLFVINSISKWNRLYKPAHNSIFGRREDKGRTLDIWKKSTYILTKREIFLFKPIFIGALPGALTKTIWTFVCNLFCIFLSFFCDRFFFLLSVHIDCGFCVLSPRTACPRCCGRRTFQSRLMFLFTNVSDLEIRCIFCFSSFQYIEESIECFL